jgi:membrane protein implicated in regulation of membrane protease activity
MGTPRSGTRGIRRYGVPIALLSTLFAAATFLNSLSAYPIVLGGLALLCGAVAAIDEDAAALLVVGTPALDAHGIFLRLPQAVTVFQVVLVCALLGFAWRFVRGTRRPPRLQGRTTRAILIFRP